MTLASFLNVAITITLIEMMVALGLRVTMADLLIVAKNRGLVARGMLANYAFVPALTVALLLLFQAQPLVAAGFLILTACPGAPYGPPFAVVAKGNVPVAVGLMVLLAGSSAVMAPLLLHNLLPYLTADAAISIDATTIAVTLFMTQLLPLCAGVAVRQWQPKLADRLQGPAASLSKVLNLFVVGAILVVQYPLLITIRPIAFVGMFLLLIASWAVGWVFGGTDLAERKSMMLTTSLRNVAVALVIATSSFAGTAAVTAVAAYGLVSLLGTLALAVVMAKTSSRSSIPIPTPLGHQRQPNHSPADD